MDTITEKRLRRLLKRFRAYAQNMQEASEPPTKDPLRRIWEARSEVADWAADQLEDIINHAPTTK